MLSDRRHSELQDVVFTFSERIMLGKCQNPRFIQSPPMTDLSSALAIVSKQIGNKLKYSVGECKRVPEKVIIVFYFMMQNTFSTLGVPSSLEVLDYARTKQVKQDSYYSRRIGRKMNKVRVRIDQHSKKKIQIQTFRSIPPKFNLANIHFIASCYAPSLFFNMDAMNNTSASSSSSSLINNCSFQAYCH